MEDDAPHDQSERKDQPDHTPATEDDAVHAQSEQEDLSEPAPAEGNEPTHSTRSIYANLKLFEVANLLLTLTLVLTTIYYAWITAKSLRVSAEMASLMKQANEINFRPYVQIEGVQAARIEQLAAQSERDANLLKTTKPGDYVHGLSADGEEHVLYSARNLGQIPAHDIKHFVEVYVVDEEDRVERLSPQLDRLTISETLFSNQISNAQIQIGKGVILRSDQKTKAIKVKLIVTYTGNRDVDSHTYFYWVILRYKPAINQEALTQQRVIIEQSDEGIVRAPITAQ